MSHAIELFRAYMGTGLIAIWFLIALLYLFLREERKAVRILFVYVPAVVLVLFFNPLFAGVMNAHLGDEIYYRILWLLPVTPTLAYATLHICTSLAGKKRLAFTLAAVCLIVVSGRLIYRNQYFSKAENLYHVPDSVVHICDAVEIPGREVTVAFPLELVQYVRQYSPVVCMPYGREILVDKWNGWAVQNPLCDAMEAEVIDAGTLGSLAREESCIYLVLPESKQIKGSLHEAGYALFLQTDGYCVYKDTAFADVPDQSK
ncbi:MAG: hypothetical protein IJ747_09570 [Lachnospiraceae bacterium]|nr:hypothetical protein [Lachnospiraceae bacterium]